MNIVPNSSGPAWLTSRRRAASEALLASGLPTTKTESWRYTSVAKLSDQTFSVPTAAPIHDAVAWAQQLLGDDDATLQVFVVDGFVADLPSTPEGLQIRALEDELATNADALRPHLGHIANSEYFAGINSALFEDGLVLRVSSEYRGRPIHIVHVSTETCYPRILIEAEPNSKCTVIETYLAKPGNPEVCMAVTELHLADGAQMDHVRVMEGSLASSHLGTLAVQQDRNSRYTSCSVAMGGKLARLEIDARMIGPGAECKLDGMYHAIGAEHVAHHTVITHADSNCSSSEDYRGLIDDRAHAVFDGIIIVDQGTKGTSAHQQNHNLLLSDSATINTKPHLEIDSDDLSASHGATVGSVDPDQLFFLRARGIDENHARSILTFSFVRSVLDRITCEPVRDRLIARLLSRLPHGDEIAELAE